MEKGKRQRENKVGETKGTLKPLLKQIATREEEDEGKERREGTEAEEKSYSPG